MIHIKERQVNWILAARCSGQNVALDSQIDPRDFDDHITPAMMLHLLYLNTLSGLAELDGRAS